MADFTKLKIWQKAHELTLKVYKLSSEAMALKNEYENLNKQINSLIRYRKRTDYGKN